MNPRTAAYAVALLVGVSGPAQSPVITALAPLVDRHQRLLSPMLASRLLGEVPALPLLNICLHASSARLERAAPYGFVDLMPAFWQFWDDTVQSAPDERTRLFRNRFVDRYAAVYRFARSGIGDGDLAAFFQRVAKREGALRRESQLLPSRLRHEWDRFCRMLPDLDAEAKIYVLPAPADAVGGWVRLLASEDVVILGFEALTTTASATEWSVLVDHELMHLYHIQRNSEMRDVTDQYFVTHAQPVHRYQLVWLEGLAMYASQVLNPKAKPGEILNGALTESIRHDMPRLVNMLRERLDASDSQTIQEFVFGGDVSKAIPNKTGYYLGMLVARELRKNLTLDELARVSGASLRKSIDDALAVLIAPTGSPSGDTIEVRPK